MKYLRVTKKYTHMFEQLTLLYPNLFAGIVIFYCHNYNKNGYHIDRKGLFMIYGVYMIFIFAFSIT